MKEGIPLFGPVPSGNKIPEDGDSRVGQKPRVTILWNLVSTGNKIPEDGDSRVGQKPDWNRSSESKAFPRASVRHSSRFPRE